MAKAATRIQLENLMIAKEAGYEIPEALLDLVQQAEWTRLGVRQVWKCKCPELYESYVRLTGHSCGKGHQGTIHWENPEPIQTDQLQ